MRNGSDPPDQILWVAWDNVLACFDIATERATTCAKPFLEDATGIRRAARGWL